jgi:hypothetical protein
LGEADHPLTLDAIAGHRPDVAPRLIEAGLPCGSHCSTLYPSASTTQAAGMTSYAPDGGGIRRVIIVMKEL